MTDPHTLTLPDKPGIPCPEPGCSGTLRLQMKPASWRTGRGAPFAYICDQWPTTRCRGLVSAHPDGEPVGPAVDAQIRRARHLTHLVFDPLWEDPSVAYPDVTDADIPRLQKTMRVRAYLFVADKLGVPEPDVHMGKCTDLEHLRSIYRVCQATNAVEIREWAKARKERLAAEKVVSKAERAARPKKQKKVKAE